MTKYWHYCILSLFVLVSLASCSTDEEIMGVLHTEDDGVTIRLVLTLGDEDTPSTRGVPANPIDEMKVGSLAENWVNDAQILVYDKNGTFVERADITTAPYKLSQAELPDGVSADKVGTYYGIEGVLHDLPYQALKDKEDFQFIVLCNMGSMEQATEEASLYTVYGYGDSPAGLGDTEFNPALDVANAGVAGTVNRAIANLGYRGYTADFTRNMLAIGGAIPSKAARIPMWGFLKSTIENEKIYTVNVLRSMAKVRVALGNNPKNDGFALKGVTLSKANSAGYLAAQNTSNDTRQAIASDGTTTNWNYKDGNSNSLFGITDPSPLVDAESPVIATPLPFVPVDADGLPVNGDAIPAAYVIYIPEYRNMDSDGTTPLNDAATISLEIEKDGIPVLNEQNQPHQLLFAKYADNNGNAIKPSQTQWDIIRNDFFDYTITRIESGRLEANVRVMPWEYETMEYELSQNAAVVLTSKASAVFNTTLSRWSNEVLYSADDESSGYATFTFKVKEPAGVRWVAHLTDPYNFTFTADSKTYGFGGTNDEYTITVKPRGKFSKVLETDLYFTIETLLDTEADITPVDANGNYVTGDYGIANRRIHIAQVETRTGDTGDEVPFRVDMSAWGTAVSSGSTPIANANKTGIYSYSGLSYPEGIVTQTIYTGAPGAMCNNGVVMAAYNNTLYCMWQTSATKEDTPDTHIHYSTLTNGTDWSTPTDLTQSGESTTGYTSSGGWLVADDKLIAYVNTWLGGEKGDGNAWKTKPTYGKTRYIDMSKPSVISEVKMEDDNGLTAIFEQDPHVITLPNGTKRIINAGHFQTATIQGTGYNNGLYVNPIYTDYSTDGISGWKKATFSASAKNSAQEQSREMEPSIFQKANGDLVMIFRDNESGTQTAAERRVRASVSHDYGLTWSDPVATNLYDSKSKQCAGNLPDGTAFIVNNPVQSETRSPLVIHLSKDGETFSQSYLLRTGYTEDDDATGGIQNKRGSAGSGYCYPKAMVHGDYLYVSYSTNKEDVEYTRIPLSSIQLNDPSAR